MEILKSNVIPESGGTSNPHPTETISAAPPCIDKLDMPPAIRPRVEDSLTDKLTFEYQRLAWEAIIKSINGLLEEVDKSNLSIIIRQLLQNNIVRGRGILARTIIKAQIASPINTNVYAALVCIINKTFPQIGELISKRLISSFRRTYQLNDKSNCLASVKFVAHLINQNILNEIIALQILVSLLENPTDDRVELAIEFLKECGQKSLQLNPQGLDSVFSTLRNLLDESSLNKNSQDMIEIFLAARKDQFKSHPVIQSGLDLVNENDQYKHMLELDDSFEPETMLDVFKYDEQYEVNEKKYNQIRKTNFKNSDDESESSSNSSDSDEEVDANEEKQERIIDQTETNLATLRHKTCLRIQPNIAAEECAKKLLKMNLYRRQDWDLCEMVVDICAQQPTYEHFFGLVGEHICLLDNDYIFWFESSFRDQYRNAHRLENIKLRNMAKFFAHLLATNSISWSVFEGIHLIERNTTTSSCVFLKNLFLELFQFFGFIKLKNHLTDPTLTNCFKGLFLRDNPENARFCINFFTSIGLGRITDELHEYINSNPTPAPPPPPQMSMYDKVLQRLYNRHPRYEEDGRKKKKHKRDRV